jgi:hypothetical protein
MRTFIAAVVASTWLLTGVLPAAAGYISPDASWQERAFLLGD